MQAVYLENRQRGRGKFYLAAHAGNTVLFNWGPCGAVGQASVGAATDPRGHVADKVRAKRGRRYEILVEEQLEVDPGEHGSPRQLAQAVHAALEQAGLLKASRLVAAGSRPAQAIVQQVSSTQRGPYTRGAWQGLVAGGAVLAQDPTSDTAWVEVPDQRWLPMLGLAAAAITACPDVAALGSAELRVAALSAAASLGTAAGDWTERLQIGAILQQ